MKTTIVRLAAFLILSTALTWPVAMAPPAAQDEPQATPTPSQGKPVVIPEAEKKRANPVPNVPEAIASGRQLFESQCAMCHGPKADGRGDLARSLKLAVPDLTSPDRQARRTDGEWFYLISHGHRDMPAEKRLVDQQKWEIVLYLRSLAKPAK